MFHLHSYCHILFLNVEHFWTFLDNNYKQLIEFQQIDVYLNEPIKIQKLIKLANQSN